MKKSICVMLALVLLLTALAVPSKAADGFKISLTPSAVSREEGSDEAVTVSLTLENNPGIWSARVFIVYPDGLSLDDGAGGASVTNAGGVFSAADDMICGVHDLPLSDSRQPAAMKNIIEANALETEGYRSACIYFESQSLTSVTTKNGALATLSFKLTDAAKSSNVLDIGICYGEHDFLYASIGSSGNVSFVSYYPEVSGASITVTDCPHPGTYHASAAPACTEKGYERDLCTQCNAVMAETLFPATGHDEDGGIVTVPSTCNVAGSVTVYCTCGDAVRTETLSLAEHTPGAPVTAEPTCIEDGSTTATCTVCGETVMAETLPATGHSYEAVVVDPTRTEQGYTVHTCTVCGDEYTDSYTDPLGGDYAPGDVNGDDNINAMDVNIVKRFLSGAAVADDAQMKACDLSGDGAVNALDANYLSRLAAGT